MKFGKVLLVAAGLLVAAALGTVLVPGHWHVQRTVEVHANAATVGPYVSDLRQWRGWTSWSTGDGGPAPTFSFDGTDSGVTKTMRWHGDKLGDGRLAIVSTGPHGGIAFTERVGGCPLSGSIVLAPSGTDLTVTWRDEAEPGWRPWARVACARARGEMARRLAESLARLKDLSEHTLRPPGSMPRNKVTTYGSGGSK